MPICKVEQHENPKGIVILLHGLNNKPTVMAELGKKFYQAQYHTLLVGLNGHGCGNLPLKNISEKDWLQDIEEAIAKAAELKSNSQLPVYFVGFSLGALTFLTYCSILPEQSIVDKVILLAPASFTHFDTPLLRKLAVWGRSWKVPGFTPAEFQQLRFLPINFYQNLLTLKRTLERNQFRNTNLPTLVIMDTKDEMVSYKKLKRGLAQYHLTNWKVKEIVVTRRLNGRKWHHLIIAEKSLGKIENEKLWQSVAHFLGE
ncbi:alpha/beta fold hydrolase [Limibacter armeniacum]|uniref:alpha/beta hydrolase n=1 Tax=Limibacter armeniacum TaxID=466084 RepID=UPI002FE5F1CD